VQQAQRQGYRSRAAYKLLEIQKKDRLIKPGHVVVDLGAAPGGWSQVARDLVGSKGAVFALDLLSMEAIAGVRFIQGDFREDGTLGQLLTTLGRRRVDLVISDMAPNLTGVAAVDQPRSIQLCELVLELAGEVLGRGGSLVVKVFQGEGFSEYLRALRARFGKVVTRKPAASRDKSREVYLVARNYDS
jgi:23S rRNA (uridine2552-2'-O)-methyltransferase